MLLCFSNKKRLPITIEAGELLKLLVKNLTIPKFHDLDMSCQPTFRAIFKFGRHPKCKKK